jgi:Uma2 family endonuclease
MMTVSLPAQSLPTNLLTVDEFEQWEQQNVHEGSYEFVRGRVLPKPAMKQNEFDLTDFLQRQFTATTVYRQQHSLLGEADSYIDGVRKRVPDLAYFTAEQRQAIRRGERVSTRFAIELLSDSESFQDVTDKIQDYFDGGAELVWYIAPARQKIYVYTSPDESKTYKTTDVISAAPVIADFSFVVHELFVGVSA